MNSYTVFLSCCPEPEVTLTENFQNFLAVTEKSEGCPSLVTLTDYTEGDLL